MRVYTLQIRLLSDATFGRGDSVPGLVDHEVEHDEYGLPYLRGKTLKGLLAEECANILYALRQQNPLPADLYDRYWDSATRLFGQPGSREQDATTLRVGNACLPFELRRELKKEVEATRLDSVQILEALTDIRRQTALDETSKYEKGSLRASRVILRQTVFEVPLTVEGEAETEETDATLLAACVRAFRRAGINRNRGLGKLAGVLLQGNGEPIPKEDDPFKHFEEEVRGE